MAGRKQQRVDDPKLFEHAAATRAAIDVREKVAALRERDFAFEEAFEERLS